MAQNVLSNPTSALDITANIAAAAASRSPKNIMKTLPELITFYQRVKVFTNANLYKYFSIHSNKSTNK